MMILNHMSVLQKKIRPFFSAFFSAGKYHKQEHTEKKEDSTRKKLSSEPVRTASFKKLRGESFFSAPPTHKHTHIQIQNKRRRSGSVPKCPSVIYSGTYSGTFTGTDELIRWIPQKILCGG